MCMKYLEIFIQPEIYLNVIELVFDCIRLQHLELVLHKQGEHSQ